MRATRTAQRALLVLIGFAVLCCYAGLAALSYAALALFWLSAPDPATTVAIVIGVGLVVGYLSYRFGRSQLLSQLEAVELPRSNAPTLYRRLDGLADRMGVDPPTVMVAQLPTPNAFALGSATGGVVILDRSLFRLLSIEELEALVAHELAHLEGYDAFVQTLAYSIFRTIAGLAVLPLAPALLLIGGFARAIAWMRGRPQAWPETIFGRVVRWAERGVAIALLAVTALVRAHSRRREYAADDRAATVTGNPLALARALRRIQRVADTQRGLLSPLYVHTDEREDAWTRLFSTHPSTDERIERLVDRARESGGAGKRIEIY